MRVSLIAKDGSRQITFITKKVERYFFKKHSTTIIENVVYKDYYIGVYEKNGNYKFFGTHDDEDYYSIKDGYETYEITNKFYVKLQNK